MSHVLVCEVCEREFRAERSDALTCGGACRQKKRRRDRDVVRFRPEGGFARDPGTRHRTDVERLETLVDMAAADHDVVGEALRLLDVQAALESPDAPLEDWDKRLTGTIRLLSSLRRSIRDAQRA